MWIAVAAAAMFLAPLGIAEWLDRTVSHNAAINLIGWGIFLSPIMMIGGCTIGLNVVLARALPVWLGSWPWSVHRRSLIVAAVIGSLPAAIVLFTLAKRWL